MAALGGEIGVMSDFKDRPQSPSNLVGIMDNSRRTNKHILA